MSRLIRPAALLMAVALLIAQVPVRSFAAAPEPPDVQRAVKAVVEGVFSQCTPDRPHENSPAVYRICRPPAWWQNNNDLVIWAHGYVSILEPIAIPEDQLCPFGSVCIPDLVNFLGYNFATTSYAVNGLAVLPGMADLLELIDLYTAEFGTPDHVLLVGASEGGLITTLSVEQHPEAYDGGMATCGPIGDFRQQINYFGDFRGVFDYFYPGLIPGDPVNVPPELLPIWEDYYYPQVVYPVVFDPANRSLLRQVVSVTDIPFDPANAQPTVETSVQDVLWYNIFSTNNGIDVLGGQPFDNIGRWYRGSLNDLALNAGIARYAADPEALAEIEAHYQTTGVLTRPLITLHTTMDQLVPYWHEVLYGQKTRASGSWLVQHVNYPPTQTYGHCAFDIADVLGAFGLLVWKVTGSGLDAGLVDGLIDALPPEARHITLHTYR